ncbi:MAG: hypothetical protein WKG06_09110 [Segetibacter sp.]
MSAAEPHKIKTISEFHHLAGLPRPEHPLISVINMEDVKGFLGKHASLILDFYTITLKRHCNGNFKYGQQQYNVQGGVMYFMAPGQVFSPPIKNEDAKIDKMSGWGLYIHPDFLWNTPVAKGSKSTNTLIIRYMKLCIFQRKKKPLLLA